MYLIFMNLKVWHCIIIIQVDICIWCYSLFLYLDKFLDAHFMYWFDINFIHFWNILLLHCLDRPFFCLFINSPKFFVLNSCRKHMLANITRFTLNYNVMSSKANFTKQILVFQQWNFSIYSIEFQPFFSYLA